MAIEFARSERISRGKGGNAVRSAAYAIRDTLYDERTGLTYKFKDDGTLQHAGILLADGTDPKFLDAGTLFNAIEGAEKRKDAQVARGIVVALDADASLAERIDMATGFARQMYVDKGLPVLVCLHSSHDGSNPHAHLIGGTRQLGSEGFAPHKVRDTPFSRRFTRPLVLATERVGELWREFQNNWFAANGKAITVDPVSPIPQEHIGPVRFRAPTDHRIAANEQARQQNAAIARDPQALAAHAVLAADRHDQAFDIGKFLAKHLPPDERGAAEVATQEKLHDLQRAALVKASWTDKVQSGLRPLMIEDVARMLDPQYAALIKRAAELREQAAKEERSRNAMDLNKEAAAYRIEERRAEIGPVRRAAHWIGTAVPTLNILLDLELYRWERMQGGAAYMEDNKGIKKGAAEGELAQVTRLAKSLLDPNHPLGQVIRPSGLTLRQEAERDLQQRQNIARNARERLDTLARSDKINLRMRRSYSRATRL